MNPEEAREEIKKMFPGGSCCCEKEAWYHHKGSGNVESYRISYRFDDAGCGVATGRSFEECIEKIKDLNTKADQELLKYSILLRQF